MTAALLNKYYNPKTGYSGVQDLVRKTGKSKKEVEEFLQKQDVYSLHKPIVRKFQRRKVYVDFIDQQWQADLVDLRNLKQHNKGFGYILMVIDCFSKYGWAVPLKKKTGEEVLNAFKKIFKERKCEKLQTDKGTEFINKQTQEYFKKEGINFFTTENETKAQIVERWNRTIKDKMFKYFTANNTKKWIDVLPDLIYNYNNSFHSSIKITPTEASLKKNEKQVKENLYPTKEKLQKPVFKIGDKVRIYAKTGDFKKGYKPNFTKEIFMINKINLTKPPTYEIEDLNGEDITGKFYKEELSLVGNFFPNKWGKTIHQ